MIECNTSQNLFDQSHIYPKSEEMALGTVEEAHENMSKFSSKLMDMTHQQQYLEVTKLLQKLSQEKYSEACKENWLLKVSKYLILP